MTTIPDILIQQLARASEALRRARDSHDRGEAARAEARLLRVADRITKAAEAEETAA